MLLRAFDKTGGFLMKKPATSKMPLKADSLAHDILSQAEWTDIGTQLALSQRELEIVQLIFDGCIEYQIARDLGISIHTVHTYIKRIYVKLNIHDQRELIVKVFSVFISQNAAIATPLQVTPEQVP